MGVTKMISAYATVAAVVLLYMAELTNGHGYLAEPPSRSSMWRFGFNTPKNYNDNNLNCGGFANQYQYQHGKCGICGDPYQGPRDNEAGGTYATGTISRTYRQGQVIDVTVDVTANHLGWFEFKLCPNNNPLKAATPECLDRHVLQRADGSGSRLYIHTARGPINLKLRLPHDVTCTQCVFQWRWHAGHFYGVGADGRGCIGCGAQQEWYGCADVEITPNGDDNRQSNTPGQQPDNSITPRQHPLTSTPIIPLATGQSGSATGQGGSGLGQTDSGLGHNTGLGLGNPGSGHSATRCYATSPLWRGQTELDNWCQYQCLTANNCPPTLCACV